MTTIAYRDGIMAADTMGTWSGDVAYGHNKLARTNKYLVGFAGSFALMRPVYDWLLSIENDVDTNQFYTQADTLPELPNGLITLIANREGKSFALISDGFCSPLMGEYEAVGCGARFAVGAMFAGSNAREGVRAAIRHDDGTGGDVVSVRFNGDPFPPF